MADLEQLTLNLTIDPSLAPKQQIYTVAAGDSLSKIKQFYSNANEYMKIFESQQGPADGSERDQGRGATGDPRLETDHHEPQAHSSVSAHFRGNSQ